MQLKHLKIFEAIKKLGFESYPFITKKKFFRFLKLTHLLYYRFVIGARIKIGSYRKLILKFMIFSKYQG